VQPRISMFLTKRAKKKKKRGNHDLESLTTCAGASAIAYVSIVSFIFAIRYLDILRWALRITWTVLGTTVAAELAGRAILGQGIASQLRPRRYYVVPRETLDIAIGDVQELINFFVIEAQRIVFAENLAASIAVSS
jgi:hypothetical protein